MVGKAIQTQLIDYSIEVLSAESEVEPEKFLFCYHYCKLTRNLQILGAFSYLSKVKGKKHFERYIPAAVRSLRSNLAADGQREFPSLSAITDKICSHMKIT